MLMYVLAYLARLKIVISIISRSNNYFLLLFFLIKEVVIKIPKIFKNIMNIKNIAVITHIDHLKTALLDAHLLKSRIFSDN